MAKVIARSETETWLNITNSEVVECGWCVFHLPI